MRSDAISRPVRRRVLSGVSIPDRPGNSSPASAQRVDVSPAVAMLKASSARVTASRIAVIDLLRGCVTPMSAGEVWSALGAAAPDRVTVYRTLNALVDIGVVQEVLNFDRVRRFGVGLNIAPVAVRFRCVQCGCSLTRPAVLPEPLLFEGCLITRQSLEVEGRCGDCR